MNRERAVQDANQRLRSCRGGVAADAQRPGAPWSTGAPSRFPIRWSLPRGSGRV